MGFLDKFKKRETQVKTQSRDILPLEADSADGENKILLDGVSAPQKIKHSNGKITDLIMAKVIKYADTIYVDEADDISFELDHGQTLDKNMLQYIMWVYDMQMLGSMPKENYLGRLTVQDGQYQLVDKSVAVQNIVNNMIATREQARKPRVNLNEFSQSLKNENAKYQEEWKQEVAQRLSNPTLRWTGRSQIGDKVYSDYDGINVVNGEILRLRNVDKVGRDGSGTYLYSAYISSVPNEHDAELIGENYPVCFTLEKRLEDIVAGGNPVEIKAVLAMLSSPENFKDMNSLVYAGKTDKYGRAINEEKMGEETKRIFESSAIGKTIQAMKKQFERDQRPRQEERGE